MLFHSTRIFCNTILKKHFCNTIFKNNTRATRKYYIQTNTIITNIGTCPYGRRCCFLHSKKEVEAAKAAAAQQNQSGTTININSTKASLKNLSVKSNGDVSHMIPSSSSNITLHSPRARTVTVQGKKSVEHL